MIGEFLQAEFQDIINRKAWDELREVCTELDYSDIAEILSDLPVEEEGVIFRVIPKDKAAAVFSYLPLEKQEELVRSLGSHATCGLVDAMTPDDRTRLLEELPVEVTRKLMESLSPDQLKATRNLMNYPPGTAGRYMTPEYVELRPYMTSAEALAHVRKTGRGKETMNVLYIVGDDGKLLEDLRLGSLVLADPNLKVSEIEDRPVVAIPANAQGDEVVAAFEKYDRVALPVTNAEGKMLGIITVDDVLEFAEKKATREMQMVGGSEALDHPYFETSKWQMIRKRGGWLAALFLGETLTATAMGKYEHAIAAAPVLALFVPLIISSGGNSGSQATSILIRSLALQEVKLGQWAKVFFRELQTSFILGIFLGLIGLVRILIWYYAGWQSYENYPWHIAFTVWGSLIGVVMFGSIIGSMLPFLLRKIGLDPATASAPFVATLVDVTGLIIYFTVASMVLHNTLLKHHTDAPPAIVTTQPATQP